MNILKFAPESILKIYNYNFFITRKASFYFNCCTLRIERDDLSCEDERKNRIIIFHISLANYHVHNIEILEKKYRTWHNSLLSSYSMSVRILNLACKPDSVSAWRDFQEDSGTKEYDFCTPSISPYAIVSLLDHHLSSSSFIFYPLPLVSTSQEMSWTF